MTEKIGCPKCKGTLAVEYVSSAVVEWNETWEAWQHVDNLDYYEEKEYYCLDCMTIWHSADELDQEYENE